LTFPAVHRKGPRGWAAPCASPLLFRRAKAFWSPLRIFFGNQTMAKPATIKIRLNSTADTGFFYVTKKNPRNQTEKLTFRKYDPIAKKHVEFKEGKIK
jgi:large subunit ribosomal protein L33